MGIHARGRVRFVPSSVLGGGLVAVVMGASAASGIEDAFADPARVAAPPGTAAPPAALGLDQVLERQGKVLQRLSPETRGRLEAAGRDVFARLAKPPPPGAKPKTMLDVSKDVARANVETLGSLAGGDIEALAFLVMMQAAKSAEDD